MGRPKGRREASAMFSAAITRSVVICSLTDQPTTLRLNASPTKGVSPRFWGRTGLEVSTNKTLLNNLLGKIPGHCDDERCLRRASAAFRRTRLIC